MHARGLDFMTKILSSSLDKLRKMIKNYHLTKRETNACPEITMVISIIFSVNCSRHGAVKNLVKCGYSYDVPSRRSISVTEQF